MSHKNCDSTKTHDTTPCSTHIRYEMGCAEFDALRARSAGHCEACGIPADESGIGRLVIDHDHRYGLAAVRGLLCSSCNSQLGALETGKSTAGVELRHRFDAYLSRAWFLHVAHLGRLRAAHFPFSLEEVALTETILRSPFVRPLTAATGQQPELEIIPVFAPGSIRHRVIIRHSIAEANGVEVQTSLLCGKRRVIKVQSVTWYENGPITHFETVAKAAAHIRKVRQRCIQSLASAHAANEERRLQLRQGPANRAGRPPAIRKATTQQNDRRPPPPAEHPGRTSPGTVQNAPIWLTSKGATE